MRPLLSLFINKFLLMERRVTEIVHNSFKGILNNCHEILFCDFCILRVLRINLWYLNLAIYDLVEFIVFIISVFYETFSENFRWSFKQYSENVFQWNGKVRRGAGWILECVESRIFIQMLNRGRIRWLVWR